MNTQTTPSELQESILTFLIDNIGTFQREREIKRHLTDQGIKYDTFSFLHALTELEASHKAFGVNGTYTAVIHVETINGEHHA